MNTVTMDHISQAPDLLKRFVPTPFEGIFAMGELDVFVRTNDPAMLELLAPLSVRRCERRHSFRWKLIHDSGAPSEIGTPMVFACGRMTVANIGPGCLVAVDYDRSELVAFLGLDGHTPALREVILPLFTALTLKNLDVCPVERTNLESWLAAVEGSHD